MKKKIIIFGAFISCFLTLFNLGYTTLITSIFFLILSFLFLKKDKRLFMLSIFVCICTIFTNALILYNKYINKFDKLENINILLGSWLYNDIGGNYVFNDDFSFYQYFSSNNFDNYCTGIYNYTYGAIDINNNLLNSDDNYFYYTLKLNYNYCIINTIKDSDIEKQEFIFSVNKKNYEDLLFIDKSNNTAFKITKVK